MRKPNQSSFAQAAEKAEAFLARLLQVEPARVVTVTVQPCASPKSQVMMGTHGGGGRKCYTGMGSVTSVTLNQRPGYGSPYQSVLEQPGEQGHGAGPAEVAGDP